MELLKKYWWVALIVVLVVLYVYGSKTQAKTTDAQAIAFDALCADVAEYRAAQGGWQEGWDWGDIGHYMQENGIDYDSGIEQVLGFAKGYNIKPSGWVVHNYPNEIKAYIAAKGKGRDRTVVGEYCK